MIKKLICFIFLFYLFFSTSCQQKKAEQVPTNSTIQVPPIPRNFEIKVREPKEDPNKDTFEVWFNLDNKNEEKEEAILKECGVLFSNDMGLIVANVTQEQFDFLKQKNIKIYKKWEWAKVENKDSKSEIDNQNRFVSDAYKDIISWESLTKFNFQKAEFIAI